MNQSVEGESATLDAGRGNMSKTPKRPQEGTKVVRNENEETHETPAAVVKKDPLEAEFARFHKLSLLATSTFVLACLTVPCCVAFIGFLWSNPNGTGNNEIWLKIVLHGWVLKSLTMSTVVLRVAIGAQTRIATSMLASIVMETKGVALHRSAAVSALRYVNNGPQSLTFALRDTYSHAGPWALVTLLLYLTTLALQFGSTILVGDLAIGSLIDHGKTGTTLSALSWSAAIGQYNATRLSRQTSYWDHFLPNFPVFAEYRENPSSSEILSDNPVRDTGTTLRSFLPFSNQSERTMIHSYNGTATVQDSRVVCVRPKLHPHFSIGFESTKLGYLLNGTLVPESVPPGLILGEQPALTAGLLPVTYDLDTKEFHSSSSVNLSWSQQIPFACGVDEWAIAQHFMYSGPTLVSSLDPRYPNIAANAASLNFTAENPDYLAWNLTYYQEGDDVRLMTGRSYELLNVTAADPGYKTNRFFSPDQEHNKLVIRPQGEWLVFTIPDIPDFQLSVSLCFDSFFSINAKVNSTIAQPGNEPSLGTWNASSGLLDTTQVREQLDALPDQNQSPHDRGVMSLETDAEQLRDQVQDWYVEAKNQNAENISFPTQNFLAMASKDTYSWGIRMCNGCQLFWPDKYTYNITYVNNDDLQVQIFQEVIRSTRDTAKAWQARYTILGRLAYYETLPYYDVETASSVASFRNIQFPQSSRGLVTVCTMLCAHVGLIILITTTFLTKTRVSRIGDNAWLNLVQADLAPMESIFKASSTMKDSDVEKEAVAQGLNRRIIRLG
ncbi:hypothetical protein KVR01_011261 [Diaporthe batatas]|uniref:uncharacterized protein n=1 Tax=Diaporthe batatas TaxID=748121 RepID=UPI001D049110|nr:uncharacterized protein KVR01_011261 [Diaporthe batatas]KAG8158818.1 hypothetical protein KVR01_011261 [Diaporthe batatas]